MLNFNRLLSGVSLIAILGFSAALSAEQNSAETKKTMQQAVESLSVLIDVALDQEFEREKGPEFYDALESMRVLTAKIGEHTQSSKDSLNLVTRSLEKSVNQMVANYKAGFDRNGEEYLVDTIDHCVACHTQSPELASQIDVGAFVETIFSEEIYTSLAARMLVAVRKIPEAVRMWESRLLNIDFSLQAVGSEEVVLEYISQAVHLDTGVENIAPILSDLQGREDTPYYFTRKLDIWKKQLALLDSIDTKALSLDAIQKVKDDCLAIEGTAVREEYPVCSILVSQLSGQMLRQLPADQREAEAELYINMGVARLNTGLPAGYVPLIESFLEAAILAAPESDTARKAYAYLEELAFFLYNDLEIAEEIMDVSFQGLRNMAGISQR